MFFVSGVGVCGTRYTRYGSTNKGSVLSLENHTLFCGTPDQVISEFKFQASTSLLRYIYRCCQLQGVGRCKGGSQSKATQYMTYGNQNILHMLWHRIDCGVTGFIHTFMLEKDSSKAKMRYKYSCCLLDSPWDKKMFCYNTVTAWTSYSDAKVWNLKSQAVGCKQGYALSAFQLRLDPSRTRIAYQFRCCKVNA